MSVIIRLQNLPWSANALDIRTYFHGLSIPEGGVHIVGGELGDAFIAFSTDEDARQAMLIDGGKIKEVKVKLFLSSRSEMQKVIETARTQSMAMQNFLQIPPATIPTTALPIAQIPPTPVQTAPAMPVMPPISQIAPKTSTPEIKSTFPSAGDIPKADSNADASKEFESEKKDETDKDHRDNKRSRRRSRSRSKSKDRSKSRDRSRSRDRYRSRRDRKRRDRSRDRSRDRRDRRRYNNRDRSRSRDRSRKTSREKKRDYDRNDRNSLENGRNTEKEMAPNQNSMSTGPGKPGFKSSGWVSAGTTDKPVNSPLLPTPTEFPTEKPMPARQSNNAPPQLPVPLQNQGVIMPNQNQPTNLPPAVPLQMPPVFPMDVLKNPDGSFVPMGFPNAAQMQNMQFPNKPSQTETNKLEGDMMMAPSGWPPMMNVPGGFQPQFRPNVPQFMNPGMPMYVNPPMTQPPYTQQDPRAQTGFPPQRNDSRPEQQLPYQQENRFSPQRQGHFQGRDFDSPNRGDSLTNACIEIRNMALNTNIMDIKRFFQGLHIPRDGIKIITDKKGNKVGMAYVRFAKPYFKDMALKKNGDTLKNSVVEILHIDDQIYDKATDFSEYKNNFTDDSSSFKQNYNEFDKPNIPNEPFTDLVIHEVPPFANDNDIYNLFQGYKILDAFRLMSKNLRSASGYIRFQNPGEAKRALMNSSRLSIKHINVRAAVCYENEFDDARDRKNMEEIDEEMDQRDSYDSSGPYSRNAPNHPQGRQDQRFQSDNRPMPKSLLPTPKTFDPRGNSFNSHSDRRNQEYPPRPRGGYNKRSYEDDDPREKYPQHRERSKFQENRMNNPGARRPGPQEDFENYPEKHAPYMPPNSVKPTPPVRESAKPETTITAPKTDSDDRIIRKPDKEKDVKETPPPEKSIDTKPKPEKIPEATPPLRVDDLKPPVNQFKTPILPTPETKIVTSLPPVQDNHQAEPIKLIETDCLILRGLPYTATDRDILDFFSDEGLSPTQIHIMLDKQEKPAGDAFCEFNTPEEVSRAMRKNQTFMGRSVVTVEAVSREQMMEALGNIIPHPGPGPLMQEFQHGDYPPQQPFYHPRGPNPRYPPRFPPRGRGAYRGRFRAPPPDRELDTQSVNSFGKPGCVVALENVPFRAEVEDILAFFRGYRVSKDNVIRRFDENGKATGDARVCLNSPVEAQRAIRTLNSQQIFNRQIYLSLVS